MSYWALSSNPNRYRILDAVNGLEVDKWATGRSDLAVGDRVIIWKTLGNSHRRGIVALGEVISEPWMTNDINNPYWRNTDDASKVEKQVDVRYVLRPNLPIWLGETEHDEFILLLNVARARGGAVFHVTPEQWGKILDIVGGWPTTPVEALEILNRSDAPSHLLGIPELDFSMDLFAERLSGPWFRLGAWTIIPHCDERDVEDVLSRQSLLLAPGCFTDIFDSLESIGNVIRSLGKPGGSVLYTGEQKKYRYSPFHQFDFSIASAVGEPLVFVHSTTSGVQLFINPDLWMYFELEEKTRGSGIWWDPRRGVDALVQHVVDHDNLEVVEIRTDYLRKYLQARQMSLVVGHYRHLQLFDPSQSTIGTFVE